MKGAGPQRGTGFDAVLGVPAAWVKKGPLATPEYAGSHSVFDWLQSPLGVLVSVTTLGAAIAGTYWAGRRHGTFSLTPFETRHCVALICPSVGSVNSKAPPA